MYGLIYRDLVFNIVYQEYCFARELGRRVSVLYDNNRFEIVSILPLNKNLKIFFKCLKANNSKKIYQILN